MGPGSVKFEELRLLHVSMCNEEELFLPSTCIELRGVEALELMRTEMGKMFVGDDIAVRRITSYVCRLAGVVQALTSLLMGV